MKDRHEDEIRFIKPRYDIKWNNAIKTWNVIDNINGFERQYFSVSEVQQFLPELESQQIELMNMVEENGLRGW